MAAPGINGGSQSRQQLFGSKRRAVFCGRVEGGFLEEAISSVRRIFPRYGMPLNRPPSPQLSTEGLLQVFPVHQTVLGEALTFLEGSSY